MTILFEHLFRDHIVQRGYSYFLDGSWHGDYKEEGSYSSFPTNRGDLNLEMARDFLDRLGCINCSNLYEYVEYCLAVASSR